MKTRLGFVIAIATSVNADFLLMDEIFGAGDRHFRKRQKRESHDCLTIRGALIKQHCKKVLWLDNGCLIRLVRLKRS